MPVANVKSNWVNGHLKFSGSGRIEFNQASAETDGGVFKAGATTAGARLATQAANQSMFREITEINHDGGYGRYNRAYIATAAISGDAFRAFATVENVAAATVRGAHISLSMGASGTVTGLGVALECTLHIPTTAGQTGTLYAVKAAINSDGAASDPAGATTLAYFAAVNQGDATGGADVDTDAVLLDIDGHTVGNGNLISAVGTAYALAEFTHSIRIKVTGLGLMYIPISNLAASAT